MNYDDFDYLEGTLSEWMNMNELILLNQDQLDFVTKEIELEYLPRFERAIHKLHSTNNSAWTHPYIEQLPFEVVTADEETQPALLEVDEVELRIEYGPQPGDMPNHVKDYLNKDDSYKDGYSILA